MNGQALRQDNETPASSQVTAIKSLSVGLHWAYNYGGDGPYTGPFATQHVTYNEQIIGFNSKSDSKIQVLAKRIGQNGTLTLQSPTPAPFNGRVEVISSNSTLVIHRLQYSDSSYRFLSTISLSVDPGGGARSYVTFLKPTINITIYGMTIHT